MSVDVKMIKDERIEWYFKRYSFLDATNKELEAIYPIKHRVMTKVQEICKLDISFSEKINWLDKLICSY